MHELLAAREPSAQDPAAVIRHPDRIDLALPQQHRQGAGVELVSLRPRARDAGASGLTTVTRSTNGSRILTTSQQLAVTSNATRSVASRLSASNRRPSGVLGTRPAERTRPSSQIATTQKSRCTSRPIARPTHLTNAIAHLHNTVVDTDRWETSGNNDTDRYELNRSIQASRRGGRSNFTGSKPIAKNGLPVCALMKGCRIRVGEEEGANTACQTSPRTAPAFNSPRCSSAMPTRRLRSVQSQASRRATGGPPGCGAIGCVAPWTFHPVSCDPAPYGSSLMISRSSARL